MKIYKFTLLPKPGLIERIIAVFSPKRIPFLIQIQYDEKNDDLDVFLDGRNVLVLRGPTEYKKGLV